MLAEPELRASTASSYDLNGLHDRKRSINAMPIEPGRGFSGMLVALLSSLLAMFLLSPETAKATPERSLALEGIIIDDANAIEFKWPGASGSKVGRVTIERRFLGQSGKHTWQQIGSIRSFARIFRDTEFRPGIAYEYRVSRPSKERIETGYWTAGTNLESNDKSGIALLVVDETIAGELAARLERFRLDLVGDGWEVIRHDVPRGSDRDPVANLKAARKIRAWIQDRYNSAYYQPHALILVGRIPVVRSGESRPDGHKARPQETDLFYADTNAIWLDDGQGTLLHNSVPSDHIEMQVGRIDFSGLGTEFGDEITQLKRYLDKNHHWRQGSLGDLRQAYGGSDHLFVEQNALRNIVGPGDFVPGGHHDAGTRQPWLLGVDFGGSKYEKYTGLPTRAVFTINFGSGKLNFSQRKNEMKALLAQPWYALSTGWGGRPAWQLHHMALGRSIGYSHLRTVNNGVISKGGPETLEYTPTGNYPWINPIWVNLLGDPTLRPFPAAPVRDLRARAAGDSVQLDWIEPDSGTDTGYRIYRAGNRLGPYQALNSAKLLKDNRYIDENPIPEAWYMVRSHSLKKVHAGSFYRYSQGAFASSSNTPPRAVNQSLSTTSGESLSILFSAKDPDPGTRLIIAPIKGVDGGRLLFSNDSWSFVADAGFSGQVDIPFSVFDGIARDEGVIEIKVVTP